MPLLASRLLVQLSTSIAMLAIVSPPSTARAQTETSTTGMKMPEEGGPLPREKMPEGSADQQPEAGEDKPGQPMEHAEGAPAVSPEEIQSKITTRWDGYLKVIAEVVENDPSTMAIGIGRNDGFRIGNARVGLAATYSERLHAYISVEASVARAEEINQQNAELTVGPRDLYLSFDLSQHAAITLGRFKAPYDLGELENEGGRVFIDSPLESRGVVATQGFEQAGMRQGRQIGVMLHRERLKLSSDGFDVGYALALTNGRTESFALNDNDRPAGFARFSLYFGPWVALNLGGFTDTRTVGQLENKFDEEVKGAEASLIVCLGDLCIQGQGLYQRTAFPTTGAPHVNTYGVHGQWSYKLWGLEAAYRFAWYAPNHRFDPTNVWEHTLGFSYYPTSVPLRFSLNATLAGEQAGKELENNRFAFLAQYTF
jgi:hypothetical protein